MTQDKPASLASASIHPVKPTLRTRRWLSIWLMLALLFTQLASAAYACPNPAGRAGEDMADMPCAMSMADGISGAIDTDLPGLCQQHCLPDSQTLDQGQALSVPGPAPAPVLTLSPAVAPQDNPAPWAAWRHVRDRIPPPALSVLHCCYRI